MIPHRSLEPAHQRQAKEVPRGWRAVVVPSITHDIDGRPAFPQRCRFLRRIGLGGLGGLNATGVAVVLEMGAREGFPRLVAVAQGCVAGALHRTRFGSVADGGVHACALHGFVEIGVVAAVLDGVGRMVRVLRVGGGGRATPGVVDSIVVRGRAAVCAWTRRPDVH